LISRESQQEFSELISGLPRRQFAVTREICKEIISKIDRDYKTGEYGAPVKKVETIFLRKAAQLSKGSQHILRRALVAQMALNLLTSILALYPDVFRRVADHVKNNSGDPYDLTDDFFYKDIRFVLGLSIPCGSQVVDRISYAALRSVTLSLFLSRNFSPAIRYARVRGYGLWFRIHTESRYLDDFNEKGWDK
jgi:hypothetical protein